MAHRSLSKSLYLCLDVAYLLFLAAVLFIIGWVFNYFLLWVFLTLLWLVNLSVIVILHTHSWRRRFISLPILAMVRRTLPPIGQTEREAIEAGDVWWEGELFTGHPDWSHLLAMPKPTLSKTEQDFLDNQVEHLCGLLDDWKNQQEECLPEVVMDYIKSNGFFSLIIPKKHGGLDFSAQAHSAIIAKIATRSIGAAITVMVPNSLGPAELLNCYGTTEQKNHYLPRLAEGKEIPCFGLTGPEVGSDASSLPDYGIVCEETIEGKKILGLRLTWDKRYITLAPIATLMSLACKLYDPDHLLGDQEALGISLILVPTHLKGIEKGKRHSPMHLPIMNGPIRGRDVFVSIDSVIGGRKNIGQGWRMMMESLAVGRAISLPALSSALSQVTYRTSGAYALIREQFNLPIGQFEGIQALLARLSGYAYVMEATRLLTAGALGQKVRPAIASAIAKYHMTEMGRCMINDAMDIHGGRAVQRGPYNYLSHPYETTPVSITVEGANVLTRNLIIFGQGALRCHPFLQKEIECAAKEDNKENLDAFDALLYQHIRYVLSHLACVKWYSFTGGRFIRSPKKGKLKYYFRQLTRMSRALALSTDFTLALLGGEFKRRERISARLGDVLSYLYIGSAVLKYQHDYPDHDDTIYVQWALQNCLFKISQAFHGLCYNFPYRYRLLGRLLHFAIFPWGGYKRPSDRLESELATHMQLDSPLRDQLTRHCYLGNETTQPLRRVEEAFKMRLSMETIIDKLKKAKREGRLPDTKNNEEKLAWIERTKLLNKDEIAKWKAYQTIRLDALAVDEF